MKVIVYRIEDYLFDDDQYISNPVDVSGRDIFVKCSPEEGLIQFSIANVDILTERNIPHKVVSVK